MTQTNTITTLLVLERIGKADLPPIEIGGSPLVIHFRKLKMNEKNSLMVAPAYQKAMAATTQHYQVMVAESEVKSKFFTCDLEDMAGGFK